MKNSNSLRSNDYDPALLNKLDTIISAWGLGWEIGPGIKEKYSLTISPNSDKSLLARTHQITDMAPYLENWEFFSWKQPKQNWNIAYINDTTIDASDWTYCLLKYPDDKLEILIKADNLKGTASEERELAVDLVLTNLLGEKVKMEKIDFFEWVESFDNENGVTQLKHLPLHIAEY